MKKLLATAATLLLAFGSVALSTNIATADEAPAVEQVTTDTTTPVVEESAAAEETPAEEPAPVIEPAAIEQTAELVETEPVVEPVVEDETSEEPETGTGTDPPTQTFSRMSTQSFEAEVYYGIIGTLQPFSNENNNPSSWKDAGPHDGAMCYKYDDNDANFANNDHATVINNGKTVILKPYGANWPGDHWEILVVKAGTLDAVTIHPTAGEWYAAPGNKDISHYIVCKGTTPEVETPVASASVQTTPGTCEAAGTVTGTNAVNATFGNPVYANGGYTIVATATGNAKFAAGNGVSGDGTTKTFTGQVSPQNIELCAVASASVQTTPGTCEADGGVVGTNAVNATFGAPVYANGGYTIVATATGTAKFAAGEGVSGDRTTKTFTGQVSPQNIELCAVASASVQTTPGTCEADGGVVGTNAVNATFGAPVYANGGYTIVATATGTAKFAAGEGVSGDRTTKTFTGQVPAQDTELCDGTVSYCHAMPADTAANGWQLMSNMPVQSVNGHKQHAADIIPPVPGILPNGLNWNGSFVVNGVELSAQEILRLGCNFDIEVPKAPAASNEYCSEGDTQDGSITVFFGDLGSKIEYRITGGDGVDITVTSADASTVYLEAGDYTVKAEGVAPYELTGQDEWQFTIGSAVNCECAVGSIDKIAVSSVVEDPECAEAGVTVKPATCLAAAGLVLGDTLHATFGVPVIANGMYTVVATADAGFRFFPGAGVSDDGTTKTFEGALAPKLTGPQCELPDLDLVTPTISFTQPTCFANGTYTVGGTDVQWSRDGVEITSGQYSLASGVEIELTAAPKAPHGFSPEQQTSWDVSFKAPTGPCDLTTLSLPNTGGGIAGGALWLGFIALGLGAAGVVVASRRTAAKQ